MSWMMARARRVASLWSWLPQFRAVGETEHLPTAAKEFHLSVSALSRSVGMLEEFVGRPLFDREGRRIVLNDAGATLLSAVRDAMRRIDDALEEVDERDQAGPVRIGARSPTATAFVVPSLVALREKYPALEPQILSRPDSSVAADLQRGDLDIALVENAPDDQSLAVQSLGAISAGVYCGTGHPLCKRKKVSLDDMLEHDFVAPPMGVNEGWPAELRRRISHRADMFYIGLEICAQGIALALLPDPIATRDGRLKRLPVSVSTTRTIYAVCRQPTNDNNRAQRVLEVLAQSG